MHYAIKHLDEAITIIKQFDVNAIEAVADLLVEVRRNESRVFF